MKVWYIRVMYEKTNLLHNIHSIRTSESQVMQSSSKTTIEGRISYQITTISKFAFGVNRGTTSIARGRIGMSNDLLSKGRLREKEAIRVTDGRNTNKKKEIGPRSDIRNSEES